MSNDQANLVTIGGEVIALPAVLNFAGLRRVLPAINASSSAPDKFEQDAAHIRVVAAALVETRPDLNAIEIEKRLRVNMRDGTDERPGLADAVNRLIEVSGLVPLAPAAAPVDGTAPEGEKPST